MNGDGMYIRKDGNPTWIGPIPKKTNKGNYLKFTTSKNLHDTGIMDPYYEQVLAKQQSRRKQKSAQDVPGVDYVVRTNKKGVPVRHKKLAAPQTVTVDYATYVANRRAEIQKNPYTKKTQRPKTILSEADYLKKMKNLQRSLITRHEKYGFDYDGGAIQPPGYRGNAYMNNNTTFTNGYGYEGGAMTADEERRFVQEVASNVLHKVKRLGFGIASVNQY